jgi:membrane protein
LSRLTAADFINQAMVLAALFMLCMFPFLILVAAVKNVDFVDSLTRHMGLDSAASKDVRNLFGPSSGTLAAVTLGSLAWLVLAASGVAAVVQSFYLRVFDVDPKDAKSLWRMPVWVVAAIAASALTVAVNDELGALGAGDVLVVVVDVGLNVAFWWWSMHFLLSGRRTWRYLLPAALATALFWLGLRVFSTLLFSDAIVANQNKYGSIGVVLILMSWLIAVGVVILLGAVVGVVWREHGPKPSAPPGRAHG